MDEQAFLSSEWESESKLPEKREFRWWWAILAPYLVLSIALGVYITAPLYLGRRYLNTRSDWWNSMRSSGTGAVVV